MSQGKQWFDCEIDCFKAMKYNISDETMQSTAALKANVSKAVIHVLKIVVRKNSVFG